MLSESSFQILQRLACPEFDKDGKPHVQSDMMDALENANELVTEFYKYVTEAVFNYLK
jgi:hypothetical protein